MLEEYKELCKASAGIITNWEKLDKNKLCELYIQNESNPEIANAYLSGIIYKFWYMMSGSFYSQMVKVAEEEDCYNWYIDCILYVLEQRKWLDPNSNLYKDPKGPEKALCVTMNSRRINFFVQAKRDKRKLNYESSSIEALAEKLGDTFVGAPDEKLDVSKDFLQEKIKTIFIQKDYLRAFILDVILNYNFCYDVDEDGKTIFNVKALKKHLYNIDDIYCMSFSTQYNIPFDDVVSSTSYIKRLTSNTLKSKISTVLSSLKHDKDIKALLELDRSK